MTTQRDYKYIRNEEALCPYCDFSDYDSWEIRGDDGEQVENDCPRCGKTYLVTRHVDTSYTTQLKTLTPSNEVK